MMTLRFSTLIGAVALVTAGAPGSARAPDPAPTTGAATIQQMDHISVQMLGTSGTPVILVPGLSSPRAGWRHRPQRCAMRWQEATVSPPMPPPQRRPPPAWRFFPAAERG